MVCLDGKHLISAQGQGSLLKCQQMSQLSELLTGGRALPDLMELCSMGSGSKPTSSVSDPMCSTHRALAYSYDAEQERLRTGPTSTGSDTSSCATKGLFGRSCVAEWETEPTSSGSCLVFSTGCAGERELPMGIELEKRCLVVVDASKEPVSAAWGVVS